MTASIRVAIADDQPLIRSGLATFLAQNRTLQLVGEASDGQEAVQLCEIVRPDVIILDARMPRQDGIAAARFLHARWPDLKILMLVEDCDESALVDALEAGVTGCLTKDIEAEDLLVAVQEVHAGLPLSSARAVQELDQPGKLRSLQTAIDREFPDLPALAELLSRHLPRIFPSAHIALRIFPNREVLNFPMEQVVIEEAAWHWLHANPEPQFVSPGGDLPWGGRQSQETGLIIVPVFGEPEQPPLGGIGLAHPGAAPEQRVLLPLVQALAEIVTGAMRVDKDRSLIAHQEMLSYELAEAARIQASILPEKPPALPGWELTARLQPARETSGDFYDFIPMDNGKLGIVVADVTDKGMGAAVFMTLCSTLIRTFASRYPTLPAFAMGLVNERILSDTGGSMFVTAFYGVLEPNTGRLRYVNAGHNPPILVSSQKGKPSDQLRPTGMALGILNSARWQQKIVKLAPGDVLLLYTDGVTEAQNVTGEFFGSDRLLRVVRGNSGQHARQIQEQVFLNIQRFTGPAQTQDDMAVMVLTRRA